MLETEKLYLFNILQDKEGKKYNKSTLKTVACKKNVDFEKYSVKEFKDVIDDYSRSLEPKISELIGQFRGKVVKVKPSSNCPYVRVFKIQNKIGYNRTIFAFGEPFILKNDGYLLHDNYAEKIDNISFQDLVNDGKVVSFEEFDEEFEGFSNKRELKIKLYNLKKFKKIKI